MGDENVHIIDPFTGTGTFITRLLQSGLISPEQLPYKYQNEIHANEIVLLAYYIAAINIEAVYHDIVGGAYQPFNGICLTDTFQLYEKGDLVSDLLTDNNARRTRQKGLDIRVIIGNPPYSAGQKSENEDNQNVDYPFLDERISETYAKHSTSILQKNLYDSYIRAIRWASDRVGNCGIMGFVSNASFIDANSMDGLRYCLADEFSSIYIFHLRGNQRTSGELSRKEGGKIFGGGSRAPIAITLFVKNPNTTKNGNIYLHDIGDYLSREQKLENIKSLGSINGITAANGWQAVMPDLHNDWIGQRDDSFNEFMILGDKKDKNTKVIFDTYSLGVSTNRDAWVYNYSKNLLCSNVNKMIDFYNTQVAEYKVLCEDKNNRPGLEKFIDKDPKNISWSSYLKSYLERCLHAKYTSFSLSKSLYRPFSRQWLYFNNELNDRRGQMPHIFPDSSVNNRVICVTGRGATKEFCALISDTLPDLEMVSKGQCFPLKLYEPAPTEASQQTSGVKPQADLFSTDQIGLTVDVFEQVADQPRYTVKDGITDAGLAHFQAAYPDETISKEDLFYYIYGLLHSEVYKARYADNLSKELPRIPCVNQAADFWAFSQAGRALAELHINYETGEPYPVTIECGSTAFDDLKDADFYVTQMKFAHKSDKSTVVYNPKITLKNIPLAAYAYVVNGKPALEWVMERQAVTTHKDSGIQNDANAWAIETKGNARYPLELFQRVITVSLETMKIVNALPKLEIQQP